MKIILIVIGALGTVPKGLIKSLVVCISSVTESMSAALRKSTEKDIGHLVRVIMREKKSQTISLNTLEHGKRTDAHI